MGSIVGRPGGTTGTYAYRAATSRHIVLKVLQVLVVLGEDYQLSFFALPGRRGLRMGGCCPTHLATGC